MNTPGGGLGLEATQYPATERCSIRQGRYTNITTEILVENQRCDGCNRSEKFHFYTYSPTHFGCEMVNVV
jgi:hypothetical protein